MDKSKKHKILVLSDINKSTSNTLKSSVSLAKIVNADIHFFYVKKPTDVVEKESQLSAMRTINRAYFSIDEKIKNIIKPISNNYGVNINQTFTIGNVKNEIEKYIDENKPDIIVLGKRKSKKISLIGDKITQFILKKHKGIIVIADDINVLEPNNELSLGLLNTTNKNNSIIDTIVNSTQKPLKSFNITEKNAPIKESFLTEKKTIDYVFEKGDDTIKNISNYLEKNNINLLFVDREKNKSTSKKTNIKEVIKNINCSLILTT